VATTVYPAASDSPTGGARAYRNLSVGVTGAVAKAAPGRLYGWHVSNAAAAAAYVKVYDKATAPTEADTPVLTLAIPAASAAFATVGPGIAFAAGIAVRATTAIADNSTAAPAANDVVANLIYA
jgi:hypothetical protein